MVADALARPDRVSLTVNGRVMQADVPAEMTLLRFLRDELGLTGAKNGCASGHCGTCTVIVNGKGRRACLLKMRRLCGAKVETIEGLGQDGHLHPLQEAFIADGAVQCGYCTPGMLMTAKALIDRNPAPLRGDTQRAHPQPQPLPMHRVREDHPGHSGCRRANRCGPLLRCGA